MSIRRTKEQAERARRKRESRRDDPVQSERLKALGGAAALLSMSPEDQALLVAGEAARQAIANHAQMQALERIRREQAEEERRRHTEFPYGIPALQRERDSRKLYDEARAKADEVVALAHTKEERDQRLDQALRDSRAFTLGLAQEVSKGLLLHYNGPDTEVSSHRTHKKKEWQGLGNFILHSGYAFPEVEKREDTHVTNGWLLNLPSTVEGSGKHRMMAGRLVLCEDGRILAINGTVDTPKREEGYLGPERRISYSEEPGKADYLGEAAEPDIAAPPLIANREKSPYVHAVDMLAREAEIQDALVNLLISSGAEIPAPEPPTPIAA